MDLISDRRALHRIPELDRDLPETLGYLRSVLEPLPCLLFSPAKSALCAFFDFGQDHSLAFRADMDALPVAEETGLPFASCHLGRMHACGHDGHMAIVLELARRLARQRSLPHNVLLVFQPAEETTGGARAICETGVFFSALRINSMICSAFIAAYSFQGQVLPLGYHVSYKNSTEEWIWI